LDVILVTFASFFAGLVDAIVGGGGLILVPALFATYPQVAPATLLGSNKSASVWGTSFAAWQYSRRVTLQWNVLGPAIVAALLGGFAGAWTVARLDPNFLRKLLPLVLVAVLAYTLVKKNLGQHHQPLASPARTAALASLIGFVLGWYDGFFGPGTGSFFIFLFVRFLGYDFLNASASAKVINLATNAAAFVTFALTGHVMWEIAAALAVANIAGGLLGSRLALKHGSTFVRRVFIVVVSALILKTTYDAFWR
jgi:uncharacterized protein